MDDTQSTKNGPLNSYALEFICGSKINKDTGDNF